MRKLLLMVLLIPVLGIGQTKNVINSTRVFPKADKVSEFEKALTAHAQKYHTGNWKWMVYDIQTGPDAGGYQITEGPLGWESFNDRGNLGEAHTNDWNKNVGIYLSDRNQQSYAVYIDSLSTVALTNFSDKIIINHMYPKPGMINGAVDLVKKMKKVWTEGKENVAVYTASVSGDPQIVTVTRLKDGLKELADGYRKSMPDRYNTAYGAGAWEAYLADYSKCVERRWSELLYLRADLGSK